MLFDTSILIAAFIESHSKHQAASRYYKKVIHGQISLVIAAHSLAEFYAVVTKLPIVPKVSPETAFQLISENISKIATLVSIDERQYLSTVKTLSEQGLTGGIVYDAIILKTAKKAKAEKLLTLNPKDFLRLCPDSTDYIIEP